MVKHVMLQLLLVLASVGCLSCFHRTWSVTSMNRLIQHKLFTQRGQLADQLSSQKVLDIMKKHGLPVKSADDLSTSLPVCTPREFATFVGRSNFLNRTEASLWAAPGAKGLRPLTTILGSGGMGKSRALDEMHDHYSKASFNSSTLFCAISYNSASFGSPTGYEAFANSAQFSLVSRILWSYFVSRDFRMDDSRPLEAFQKSLFKSMDSENWNEDSILMDVVDILCDDFSVKRKISRATVKFVLGIDEIKKSKNVEPVLRGLLDCLLRRCTNTSFLITLLSTGPVEYLRSFGREIVFSDLTLLDKKDSSALLGESGVLDVVPLGAAFEKMSESKLKEALINYFYYQSAGHPRTLAMIVDRLKHFADKYSRRKLVLSKLSQQERSVSGDYLSAANVTQDVADILTSYVPGDTIMELLKRSSNVLEMETESEAAASLNKCIENGSVIATSESIVPMISPLLLSKNILRYIHGNEGHVFLKLKNIIGAVGFNNIIDTQGNRKLGNKETRKGGVFEMVWANVLAVRRSLHVGAEWTKLSNLFVGAQYHPSSLIITKTFIRIPIDRDCEVDSVEFKHDFPHPSVMKRGLYAEQLFGTVLVPHNKQRGYDILTSYATEQDKPMLLLYKCKIPRSKLVDITGVLDEYQECASLDWKSMGIDNFSEQVILVFAAYDDTIESTLLPGNVMILNTDCLSRYAGPVMSHLCHSALWTDLVCHDRLSEMER
jgi:hypothetical protein